MQISGLIVPSSLMTKILKQDYIIFLSMETTHDRNNFKFNYRKQTTDSSIDRYVKPVKQDLQTQQNADSKSQSKVDPLAVPQLITDFHKFIMEPSFPNIVEIDWQVLNVKKNVIEHKETLFVRPTNLPEINNETHHKTGVSQLDVTEKGLSLADALKKLNAYICEKMIMENQSFIFATFGDWQLQYQLPIECTQKDIKLAPHFSNYFNIFNMIFEQYGVEVARRLESPIDIVQFFGLGKDILDVRYHSAYSCQLIVLLFIDRILKDWNLSPDLPTLQRQYSPTDMVAKINGDQEEVKQSKGDQKKRNRSRSRSFERSDTRQSIRDSIAEQKKERRNSNENLRYIKISKNIGCIVEVKNELIELLLPEIEVIKGIPKDYELKDFVMGMRDGQIFRMLEVNDKSELQDQPIRFDHGELEDINVDEITQKEFKDEQEAKDTSGQVFQLDKMSPSAFLSLKLRGIPYSCKRDDIVTFFKGYDMIQDKIKIGRNADNTLTGDAAVLFRTEDECKKAFLQRQGKNIAQRWIELYQQTFADYENFEQSQEKKKTVKLRKYLTESNIDRVMKLRGLPFSATHEQIVEFFGDQFGLSKSDVVIEEVNGKKTGFALVFFKDQNMAKRARETKNKQSIGNRYVEILECGVNDLI